MKSLPREGIRHRRMARHTEGIVIALGLWPCHPPLLPAVKIGGCGFLIPGDSDCCFGLIGASRLAFGTLEPASVACVGQTAAIPASARHAAKAVLRCIVAFTG